MNEITNIMKEQNKENKNEKLSKVLDANRRCLVQQEIKMNESRIKMEKENEFNKQLNLNVSRAYDSFINKSLTD